MARSREIRFALALAFVPYGATDALLASGKPFRGFHSDDPLLNSVRLERVPLREGQTCASVLAALGRFRVGEPYAGDEKPESFRAWQPWAEDDDAIDDCDKFPCKIKLDAAETELFKARPKTERKAAWYAVVAGRVAGYAKTGKRKLYDLPGEAIDPWGWYPKQGFPVPEAALKAKPEFYIRKYDFAPGKFRQLRQVFDERVQADAEKITFVARDVYTAHYFDGWGEWIQAACDAEKKEWILAQSLFMEFDLLKNTDLLSWLSRGKMRMGVEEAGVKYLDLAAEKLKALAAEGGASAGGGANGATPAASASSGTVKSAPTDESTASGKPEAAGDAARSTDAKPSPNASPSSASAPAPKSKSR